MLTVKIKYDEKLNVKIQPSGDKKFDVFLDGTKIGSVERYETNLDKMSSNGLYAVSRKTVKRWWYSLDQIEGKPYIRTVFNYNGRQSAIENMIGHYKRIVDMSPLMP